jgi:hypothetical protein
MAREACSSLVTHYSSLLLGGERWAVRSQGSRSLTRRALRSR